MAGRLTRSASALGTRLLSYDPAGRLSTVSLGRPGPDDTLVDFATQKVAYDGWERIASLETRASDSAYSSTDAYTYDAAGRIATWNRSGWAAGSNSYGFDAAGNLTSRKVGPTLTGFAYNAANQLTTETVGANVTTHTYDEFGRLTRTASSAEATTYAYDALGKLASVSRPGMSAAYAYGPSGMRERKDVTTSGITKTTYSVWSGLTLVAEKDSEGTTYEYVYGAGVPLELVKTTAGGVTTRYGYQTDAAGSVIGITDEAGTVIVRYAYDAYGVPTESWGSDPVATRNPLRYRGYYWDAETSLYYLPARYYEPKSARFLSVDPASPEAGDPVSLNRYAYCLGDPVNYWDPTGLRADYDGDGEQDVVDHSAQNYVDDPTPENRAITQAAYLAKTGSAKSPSAADAGTGSSSAALEAGRAAAMAMGAGAPSAVAVDFAVRVVLDWHVGGRSQVLSVERWHEGNSLGLLFVGVGGVSNGYRFSIVWPSAGGAYGDTAVVDTQFYATETMTGLGASIGYPKVGGYVYEGPGHVDSGWQDDVTAFWAIGEGREYGLIGGTQRRVSGLGLGIGANYNF